MTVLSLGLHHLDYQYFTLLIFKQHTALRFLIQISTNDVILYPINLRKHIVKIKT